jgi:hypothetical protein
MHNSLVPQRRSLQPSDSRRLAPLEPQVLCSDELPRYVARVEPASFGEPLIRQLVPAVVLVEHKPIWILYALDRDERVAPLLVQCTSPLLRGRGDVVRRQCGLVRLCEMALEFNVGCIRGALLHRGTLQVCQAAAADMSDELLTHAFFVAPRAGGYKLLDARSGSGGLDCGIQLLNDPRGTSADGQPTCEYYMDGHMRVSNSLEGVPALDATWETLEAFELTWDYGKDYHNRLLKEPTAAASRIVSGDVAALARSVCSGEHRIQKWLSERLMEALPLARAAEAAAAAAHEAGGAVAAAVVGREEVYAAEEHTEAALLREARASVTVEAIAHEIERAGKPQPL